MTVHIELFGVPRLRAGTGQATVEAGTVGEALEALLRLCPALDGVIRPAGPSFTLHPAYKLNLNGDRFITGPATPLSEGDVLLLLAADVGG